MVTLSFFKQFLTMSKIRINELARELEVKPNRILELLPEFGVEEKKTHSSSIDEDVAVAIKQKLGVRLGLCLRADGRRSRAVRCRRRARRTNPTRETGVAYPGS